MQSLPKSSIILDIGSGNLDLDLANVIRMDVTLTPYVDVVGDAHALPFLPGVFDFIFSLAVIEHLRNPFVAANEMFDALKNGGYIYGDCNFVFAYHGYPHHYFNASEQGLEEVFKGFEKFRTGVAPYQMPSAALTMILRTYLAEMTSANDLVSTSYRAYLSTLLEQPLTTYDALFTEEAALKVAAGTFYFGRKALPGPTEVVPTTMQELWNRDHSVQSRFPQLFDLGQVPNIMLWAKGEGRKAYGEIDDYFTGLAPFHKHKDVNQADEESFATLPVFAATFAAIPGPPDLQPISTGSAALRDKLEKVTAANEGLVEELKARDLYIQDLHSYIESKQSYIDQLEAQLAEGEPARIARKLRGLTSKLRTRARRSS